MLALQGCWGASALISFGGAEAPASLPAQSAANGMLGIRKKAAEVAAANERAAAEEEPDAAAGMLSASSADTGSGSEAELRPGCGGARIRDRGRQPTREAARAVGAF
eukprot:COSAG06_NODE_3026_length_5944_cov_8.772113_4_plen_107_part_00